MAAQQKKQYSGGVTVGARKRLAKAITIMCQAIKPRWILNPVNGRYEYHRLSFITLTVASDNNITARQAYDSLLAPFLDWMRKTMGVKTYIWKAELQQRGQIHYHITTPSFIHCREISSKWNELQRKAGLLEGFAKKFGHFNPPSTEIRAVRSMKKMDHYLIKELGKSLSAIQVQAITEVNKMVERGELEPSLAEEKIKEIESQKLCTIGKIWDCSNDLSGVSYFTLELTMEHERKLEQWVAEGLCKRKTDDFYAIFYCDNADPPDLLAATEKKAFEKYLEFVMNRNEPKEAEIPAYVIQAETLDIEQTYTWKQIEINLN